MLTDLVDQMQRGSGERYLTPSDHLDGEKPGTAQVNAGVAALVGAPDKTPRHGVHLLPDGVRPCTHSVVHRS